MMAPSSDTLHKPTARAIQVPLKADSVEGPIVTYGKGPAAINFLVADGSWGRVTFEKLDAIRVSRGEYDPYESDWKEGDPIPWVSRIDNSPWLQERYAYEAQHYGHAYEFGGDVDEMLRDYSHFVFRFHDEFVETLSAGIWMESSPHCLVDQELDDHHPLHDLPESSVAHRFEAHGITCQVRRNARPVKQLLQDASLCSQKLMQFAAELDGTASVSWTVTLRRAPDGPIKAYLKGYFGKTEQQYNDIPTLDAVQPHIEAWLAEVCARRKQMGKP